jgi:hypothetical protein
MPRLILLWPYLLQESVIPHYRLQGAITQLALIAMCRFHQEIIKISYFVDDKILQKKLNALLKQM